MTSRDFSFWLQGFFELGNTSGGLNSDQVECIKRHLALVFIHDIDPKAGDSVHQAKLNEAHAPPKPATTGANQNAHMSVGSAFCPTMRC